MKNLWFGLLLGLFFLSACKQDDTISDVNPVPEQLSDGFFILNEGGFTFNNASIDYYDYNTDSLFRDIYFNQNEELLGDVLQSAKKIGSDYFLSINNSGKVIRTDSLLNKISEIDQLTSPRYMTSFEDKLFISDLYANHIHVANLSTNTVYNTINTGSWSEGILSIDSFVIVCLPDENKLLLIDAISETKIDSIEIGGRPSSIIAEANLNTAWVLGAGNFQGTEQASLSKIHIVNDQLELICSESIDGSSGLFPKLCKDQNENLFLAIGSSMFKQEMLENQINLTFQFEVEAQNIYGINYNPIQEELLVADAIDYVQRGIIFRYSPNGILIDTFKTGIIPSDFLIIQ
jgi:hypothetical protein